MPNKRRRYAKACHQCQEQTAKPSQLKSARVFQNSGARQSLTKSARLSHVNLVRLCQARVVKQCLSNNAARCQGRFCQEATVSRSAIISQVLATLQPRISAVVSESEQLVTRQVIQVTNKV